jgi:hypothetical protein
MATVTGDEEVMFDEKRIRSWRIVQKYGCGCVEVYYDTPLSGEQHRCNFDLNDIDVLENIIGMLEDIKDIRKKRQNPVGYT